MHATGHVFVRSTVDGSNWIVESGKAVSVHTPGEESILTIISPQDVTRIKWN